jgi:hypothetical protein
MHPSNRKRAVGIQLRGLMRDCRRGGVLLSDIADNADSELA